MAAVLGLTDLLGVADEVARKKRHDVESPILRVTHWRKDTPDETPDRVFDTVPGAEGTPAVLVLPPAFGDPISRETASRYATWLRESHSAGASLASVCTGAFILGETGLLAGRTVTTHWTYDEAFRMRFPGARLDTDRMIIDDGDLITSGGAMSWIDLGLILVDRILGPTIMIETARLLLVDPPGREQRYYSSFSPKLTHGDAAVLKVQHWLQANETMDTGLATLLAEAGLEERTFLRRFQKATGLTTTEYIQRLRVGKAQDLLQFRTRSIESVAWTVGYADVGAFRKVFSKIVGLTPGEYRRRFQGQTHAGSREG